MNFKLLKDSKAKNFITGILSSHGSTLAMGCGFAGFGLMLWSAFKASKEIARISEESDQKIAKIKAEGKEEAVEKQEIREAKTNRNIRYVLAYRWVIMWGAAGTAFMVLTKIMDGNAIATWMGIAATQKDKLEKVGESAKKLIGEEKYKEIEDQAIENTILQNFMSNGEPFALELVGEDTDIFLDPYTSMIFPANKASLTIALNNAKDSCQRNHGMQASKIYEDVLGIDISSNENAKKAGIGALWWGPKNQFDWKFGECHGKGCTWQTIEWVNKPTTGQSAGVPGFSK